MNCDPLARLYRWIEYAALGSRLEKHRLHFLSAAEHSRKALLLGDGDGRFLSALVRANPGAEIDSVELSPKMMRVAQERLRKLDSTMTPSRVRWIGADARTISYAGSKYDLIVTNFFLDCFSNKEVQAVVTRVRAAAAPGASWIVSEFRKPAPGWRAWHASVWLRTMYLFFRLATGLETQQLPDYAPSLRSQGFTLAAEQISMAGLITSELWVLTEPPSSEA